MSQLGLGVMINMLSGGRGTAEACQGAIGKVLTKASLANNQLRLDLADGTALTLEDDGQSCCESRYMVCDDDLASFAGAEVVGFELREASQPTQPEYECHDVQFLVVKTSKGEIVCSNHVEHNGYYGGFSIRARMYPAT